MPLWIPIAFLAVILWVIGNLTDKFLIERFRHDEDEDTDANTLFLFSAFFALPILLFALIMGATFDGSTLQILTGVFVGVCNGFYILFYLYAISKTELSRVAPVFQSVPIFTAIFGFIFLGEVLTLTQIFAGMLVLIGAATLSYQKGEGRFTIAPFIFIGASSVAVALQFTLFKATALGLNYWSGVLWSNIGLILFGVIVYMFSNRSRKHFNNLFIHRNYRVIAINLANELNEAAAVLVFTFATLLGPIALVQTVHAYHPIILLIVTTIAAKLGFKELNEDTSRHAIMQKTVGILLIAIGSACIYIPLILSA